MSYGVLTSITGNRSPAPPTDLEGLESGTPSGSWWSKTGYIRHDERFNVPALHVNSWYDYGAGETLSLFNLMRTNAESPRARDNQFAIISPTTHCRSEMATKQTVANQRDVGDARLDYVGIYLRWFERWLKSVENGVTNMPKLQIYIMGKDEWCGENEWPLARTRFTKYFLHSDDGANSRFGDGVLDTSLPRGKPADSYVYDPRTPVPSVGGTISRTSWYLHDGALDQSDVETRQDVLVYSRPVLREGVEVTGPIEVFLYVSSSAKDTDFFAKLVEVYPDGTAYKKGFCEPASAKGSIRGFG